ncbi:MAG: helix-turn-helix domain-containing protein [Solirubrobacteraceae bacterium]
MSEEARRVEVELEHVSYEVVRFEAREIARLLDRPEVARILSIDVKNLDRIVGRRELPRVRIGTRVLFIPQDVLDYIERNRGWGT